MWVPALLLAFSFSQVEIEVDPSALEWYLKGEELIGSSEAYSERQAEFFKRAVELAPEFVPARFNLILVYLRQDRLSLALKHSDELVRQDPEDVRSLQLRAQVLGRRGEVELAAKDLAKASQLKPESYEVWQDLGRLLYQERRLEESLAAYEKALTLRPPTDEVFFEIAMVQQAFGKDADAAKNYQKFLVANPDDFQANFLLGVTLRQQGKKEEALRYLLRAESLEPETQDVVVELRTLYLELGDMKEVEERVGSDDDTSAESFFRLGLVAKDRQAWEDAARYFERSLSEDPENSSIWTQLGDVLVKCDKMKDAAGAYEKAIEFDRDDFNSLLNLAVLYGVEGRPKEAVELLEHAVALRPESSLAHLNLALVQDGLGDFAAAQVHYLRAIEEGSSNPEAHFRVAILYSKQGRREEALEHLSIAFEKNAVEYVPMVMDELKNVNSDLDNIRYTAKFNDLLERYRSELQPDK